MVNKAKLIERIAELARNKDIDGITDVNVNCRDGMRIVIDVRRDASAEVILNNLYKMTLMQTTFNFNMLAIVNGLQRFKLETILQYYLEPGISCTAATEFELKKARIVAHCCRIADRFRPY